jgi:hypothetical protein
MKRAAMDIIAATCSPVEGFAALDLLRADRRTLNVADAARVAVHLNEAARYRGSEHKRDWTPDDAAALLAKIGPIVADDRRAREGKCEGGKKRAAQLAAERASAANAGNASRAHEKEEPILGVLGTLGKEAKESLRESSSKSDEIDFEGERAVWSVLAELAPCMQRNASNRYGVRAAIEEHTAAVVLETLAAVHRDRVRAEKFSRAVSSNFLRTTVANELAVRVRNVGAATGELSVGSTSHREEVTVEDLRGIEAELKHGWFRTEICTEEAAYAYVRDIRAVHVTDGFLSPDTPSLTQWLAMRRSA